MLQLGLGELSDSSVLKVLASQPGVGGWLAVFSFVNIREPFAHFGLAHFSPLGTSGWDNWYLGDTRLPNKFEPNRRALGTNRSQGDGSGRQDTAFSSKDVLSDKSLVVTGLVHSHIYQV